MQSVFASETTRPVETASGLLPQAEALSTPRTERWRQRLVCLTQVSSDIFLALLIWEVACLVEILWAPGYLSAAIILRILPIAAVWVGFRAMQGLYPGYGMGESEELRRQTYALLATVVFVAIFALAFDLRGSMSWYLLALVFMGLLLLSPLMRHFTKKWLNRNGVWGKPVIIVGAEAAGKRLQKLLGQEWGLGFKPVALFEVPAGGRLAAVKEAGEGRPDEGVLAEAMELGGKHRVGSLFLAMPHAPREHLAELADLASAQFRNVFIIPDLAGVTNSAVVAWDLAGTLGVEVRYDLLDPWVRRFKRGLDLIGVLVGGLLISPLLIALAALIKLDSPGPAFFRHRRLGADNRHFWCWKFRTMHADAQRLLEEHLKDNPHLRSEWEENHKLRDDPRVTRIGRFLRKSSLDELPQLWNVLRGEMSLVGPRPIVDDEKAKYGRTYELYKRIRPGMSGFWQVSGRSETSYESRVGMDAYYVRNWCVWLDFVILARTLRTVILGRGAH